MKIHPIVWLCFIMLQSYCVSHAVPGTNEQELKPLLVGAERMDAYLPLLQDKKVGVVVNHTSIIGHPTQGSHLVDSLIHSGVQIKSIFTPEHGFRGTADAGEHISNDNDPALGIPIVSLYGATRKPLPDHLEGLDVVVFDIQDVGARFYTYISTMHYVMEACAEQGIPVIVLDRPNPNGFYVDGPVLDTAFRSFVGMHPVPIVHGMTIGEYAQMINGEKWLEAGIKCDLTVITCQGYSHELLYDLRVKPSPNLPNMTSIYLYPSICLFEGTQMSIGRGTEFPFQVVGHPDFEKGTFEFTPESTPGASKPKLEGKLCKGYDLRDYDKGYFVERRKLDLQWLLITYNYFKDKGKDKKFFISYFDKLAGTTKLREQLEAHESEKIIRASWQADLSQFKTIRKKYLLYPDFTR